jgi:hypothetical protein
VDREALLRRTYAAFNDRDVDTVLAAMAEDVDWPNAWEGGRLRGRDAVREYWRRQFEAIDPHLLPVSFAERPDGRVAVEVDQVLRDARGRLIAHANVVHVYAFEGDLVARMDVEEAQ